MVFEFGTEIETARCLRRDDDAIRLEGGACRVSPVFVRSRATNSRRSRARSSFRRNTVQSKWTKQNRDRTPSPANRRRSRPNAESTRVGFRTSRTALDGPDHR
ncbi:hypothetical protein EA472_00335 [Natrarchaeobius oligotrophus]|uniref:Uncharacterized protein n=1 Tax=Natrarchaeobius chitinivorans TaxID=1679083 RepID=A0A3N6MG98_NATCH|nr:hypothetical protein EA472_00335 [Natrarchaeobius chitinivorans]